MEKHLNNPNGDFQRKRTSLYKPVWEFQLCISKINTWKQTNKQKSVMANSIVLYIVLYILLESVLGKRNHEPERLL